MDLLNYKVLDMKKNNINCTKEIKELEKIDNALCTVKAKGFAYKATWDAIMIMKKLSTIQFRNMDPELSVRIFTSYFIYIMYRME